MKPMWNNCKLYYQQLHLQYLCNLARYWLKAPWGRHDSVETCRSVIICEIIVHLLVIVQNNKTVFSFFPANCCTSYGPSRWFTKFVSCCYTKTKYVLMIDKAIWSVNMYFPMNQNEQILRKLVGGNIA